ncbi:MAG: Gfo/Idh/MocA family oxidoreductase [Candidatus Hydrogenedentota bacterium]
MKDKIKVGVIGVGYLGQHHARILSSIKGVDLETIVDIDKKRGESIAKQYNAKFVRDYRELKNIDAVSVAIPTESHFEVASYFLKNRIDVLVEKPITNNLEQASNLVKTAEKNGCILQVGHVERFNGAVLELKKYVKNPLFIEIHRLSSFPQRAIDVGVVLDIMIHDLDIVLYLVKSEIKKIQAYGAKVLTDKEDIANVRLEFENGCIANITASRISWEVQRRLRIFEKDSYFSLDYKNQTLYRFKFPAKMKKCGIPAQQDIEVISVPVQKNEPLRLELENFIYAVRKRKKTEVSGEEGRDVLHLALKILSCIKTNR